MKWIKASERLPEIGWQIGKIKYRDEVINFRTYFDGKGFTGAAGDRLSKDSVEWLDESDYSDEEAAFTEEDVENLANEYITNLYGKGAHGSLVDKRKASFIEGYKAASKTFTDYLKSKQEL